MANDLVEGGIDQLGEKVGVFGGTFDPVHNGHIALVSQFKEQCALDSVIVIPAASPPHKLSQPLSDFEHRFNLLSLAFSATQGTFLSRLEQFRAGPSYSVDTLKQLRGAVGEDREWFFAVGEDAFNEIHTWKQYQHIPDLACLVVFNRKLSPVFSTEETIRKFFPNFCQADQTSSYFENGIERIRLLDMPEVDVSSSQIRQAIADNEEWQALLPQAVSSYIVDHHLYK